MIIPIQLENSGTVEYAVTIDRLPKLSFDTKVAIVTNPTVSALHLEKLLSQIECKELHVVTVPDGEKYKNLDTVVDILDELFSKKLDRKSQLIAFGGGVIGDMTGFTASLYQRGIGFIQIPTTLLSQVDASVGGKTGVNNRFGKNLIGAFYQPKAVYIDTDFLDTLPKREFSAGVAEIIKMAVMFDADYFEYLEGANLSDKSTLEKVIQRSVELKAWVVNQDEKEAGIRAVLNYGHTFAHVIENETEYKKYLHGEAVAIGIVMANRLAHELGLMSVEQMDRVEALLLKHSLPVEYEVKDIDAFYDKFFLDKKSANDRIKFILPNGIGAFEVRDDIDVDIIKRVLI
ncbi:3-dehydroquinate synthase [Sulfurovum sp. bin170]|uniref:3-dehydroquinate synthase n=1 Tax=Sulfurovum sp. bin170 TaxID=2695268 RepID=UPI0013DF4FA8|nr:3-dehydroquinate synthase [Sulfurovum sp. bin170]NEW60655.1 3-dehydroquinate synthase [Sulfurovum sp. bin170]